jgi:regulator of protease activity HflC (stomatin/prohibitin superfamily)
MKPKQILDKLRNSVGLAALLIIGMVVLFSSFTIVDAGERGVLVRLGEVQDVVFGEGLHFKTPLITRVEHMDVRIQKIETDADSASRDLQSVTTTIALNYHLDPEKVNKVYQEVAREYEIRIIHPAIQESVKSATAQFTAEELITKRPEVKNTIRTELANRLNPRSIVVDEFSIVNFSFSKEFDQAIEAKQTAEQRAQKAKRDLERIKLEAQQKIERAKAEAESLRLQREELSSQLLQLRWIEKWDGQTPKYWGQASPFIGLNQ